MVNIYDIALPAQVLAQPVEHDYRAVLAAGASQGDAQIGLALLLIIRDQELHHVKEFAEKGFALIPSEDI